MLYFTIMTKNELGDISGGGQCTENGTTTCTRLGLGCFTVFCGYIIIQR